MGSTITLTASDGFKLGGYRADPQGKPKGGLVVIQEIFGVNHHIRNVCDRFAAQGYAAVAPAVFDRIQPNFECGYTPAEVEHARTFIPKIDWAKMMLDTAAAIAEVKSAGKVGIVGYCMGGSVAFLAAGKLDGLSCADRLLRRRHRQECRREAEGADAACSSAIRTASIPMTDIELIKEKRPDVEVYVYKGAGHGFACDERGSYNEAATKEALGRTLAWLTKYVG